MLVITRGSGILRPCRATRPFNAPWLPLSSVAFRCAGTQIPAMGICRQKTARFTVGHVATLRAVAGLEIIELAAWLEVLAWTSIDSWMICHV